MEHCTAYTTLYSRGRQPIAGQIWPFSKNDGFFNFHEGQKKVINKFAMKKI